MRIFLAALLAAFLALPAVAADRPVGPEAGQSRTQGPGQISDGVIEPDERGDYPTLRPATEMAWDRAATIRWMQWYERTFGPIGF